MVSGIHLAHEKVVLQGGTNEYKKLLNAVLSAEHCAVR
jgi:hypothetical protein